MARLIFCFFAEDTGIFRENQFTAPIPRMGHAGHGSGAAQWGNLRKRLAANRVFDPACGSGNFLVIAYKEMRAIEAVDVERLGGEANLKLDERRSVIPLPAHDVS